MISIISVRERSTNCSCRQRSQASGPIHVKSGGRVSEVKPASRKQHSGKQRVKLAGLYSDFSKSSCRKAVHFSKARGINSACGASWLVASFRNSNLHQGAALFKDLGPKLLVTWDEHFAQCVATAKDSRLQADNCAVQMHNLEVLAVAPCSLPYDAISCVDLHMSYLCNMRK